jgi:hypothetical protein
MGEFVVTYELFKDWVGRGRPATIFDPYTTKQMDHQAILNILKDDPREMPPELCIALGMPSHSTYGRDCRRSG